MDTHTTWAVVGIKGLYLGAVTQGWNTQIVPVAKPMLLLIRYQTELTVTFGFGLPVVTL
jgi:hypothetical protein